MTSARNGAGLLSLWTRMSQGVEHRLHEMSDEERAAFVRNFYGEGGAEEEQEEEYEEEDGKRADERAIKYMRRLMRKKGVPLPPASLEARVDGPLNATDRTVVFDPNAAAEQTDEKRRRRRRRTSSRRSEAEGEQV